MISRAHILAEIRRLTKASGGVPPGVQRFYSETGIKESAWEGRYWVRWGDALKEAGFSPNRLTAPYAAEVLLTKLAGLVRELGHFPVAREMSMKARQDREFPSRNTFDRFGGMRGLRAALVKFCQENDVFGEVIEICGPLPAEPTAKPDEPNEREEIGSVYLLKSGRYFKIGRTNSLGRREYELAIQLPERAKLVHEIRTDDPPGIEAYWHGRFATQRKNGEWFELTAKDVSAFRKRKFM